MSNKPIKLWQYLVPIVVLLAIWFYPVPEGLKPQAWHMFAIFVATIVGILCAPLPSGALMFIALALSIFTNTLSFKAALSGFASGTVWMIFSAYVLSLGFVQSGLGRRIAYKTLSLFGGSSLGIAYSLGIADLILAPAMPSVTARSGGIILPISKSIDQVLDSEPGPKQKRLGEFLTMTCFQFTPITGAMFMTGMAANPLCATLAKEGLGIGLAALLFAMGAVNWKDVLADKAAWDTVVWFGVIISLATGLTSLGFIKWMSAGFASMLTGMDWMTTFILLGFAYIYLHYVFATASGHVAAMYVPFAAVAIGAGAPPLMVAVCFAIFSNFMWGITEYAGGPGPIYFGQGFFERPRFYKINFVLVTASVIIVFAVGMLWWKIIGLY